MKRTGSALKKRPKKSGFVYHKRDPEAVRKRAARQGARYDSPFKDTYDQFRPRMGNNDIRICPPTWEGAEHWGLVIWVHKRIGPDNGTYLCPFKMKGKKCPICDAAREARDAGEAEEAQQLEAKENIVMWVLDREGDDPLLPMLYMISWTADRDITALCEDKRTGKILFIDHPDDGYDLYFKRSGQGLKTRYTAHSIDRHSSPICDDPAEQEEVLTYINENPLPTTLKYFDFNYLEKQLSGGAADNEEEEEEDEEEEEQDTRRSRSSSRRGSRKPDPEDEEEEEDGDGSDEEEEEEEEEDTRDRRSSRRSSKSRRSSRTPAEEDEEQDEEADEEEDEEEDQGGEDEEEDDGEESEEAEEEEDSGGEEEEEDEPPRRTSRRPVKKTAKKAHRVERTAKKKRSRR
jgi:hypothetical protein